MWALRVCWLLLGTLSVGSAQLLFEKFPFVEVNPCYASLVVFPCKVTNLNLHNTGVMFVTWKYENKNFFTFDGVDQSFKRNSTFQSADFLNLSELAYGNASLVLSITEALPGNYSCDVVESNREGESTIELKYSAKLEGTSEVIESNPLNTGGSTAPCPIDDHPVSAQTSSEGEETTLCSNLTLDIKKFLMSSLNLLSLKFC